MAGRMGPGMRNLGVDRWDNINFCDAPPPSRLSSWPLLFYVVPSCVWLCNISSCLYLCPCWSV